MHAMPPRLAQLSLDPAHSSHPPSTPSQGSPYRSCAASANLSSTSMHPSPIHFPHSYRVAHHGGSMHVQCADLPPSLSPAIASPVPSSAGAGPSSLVRQHSSHGQADRTGSPPPPTPRPLEPVVTTSTLESAHDDNGRPMVNQYVIYQRIGKGQHGSVYKAFDRDMPVAIKVCRRKNKKEDKMEMLRQRNQPGFPRTIGGFNNYNARPRIVDHIASQEKKILREIAIMKKCQHGQIVQLYEVINDRMSQKIFLVMEYMGGGEVKWRDANNRPCLQVDQVRRICRDVVLGLQYLHHQGIIHRDIKPANLLWTDDRKNVKITDFGVSYFSTEDRMRALRQNPQYQLLLEARRRQLQQQKKKQEEEPSKRARGGWRGRTKEGKDDIKGKGRAFDSEHPLSPFPPSSAASSSALSSEAPTSLYSAEDARLEAEVMQELEGKIDPILIDDGGLSRQAGTPSFLAPEIVWEFRPDHTDAILRKLGQPPLSESFTRSVSLSGVPKSDGEGNGRDGADMDKAPAGDGTSLVSMQEKTVTPHEFEHTSSEVGRSSETAHLFGSARGFTEQWTPLQDTNLEAVTGTEEELVLPPRPPITKAIDVWALGVTLYCLLFGRVPWSGATEYAMYGMIHSHDFVVDDYMGFDRVFSGGRHPSPNDESEGAVIVRLLDRLLEKGYQRRITLEEVKSLPWITRDIPNPTAWLIETAPSAYDTIDITRKDEEVAVSDVKFRYNGGGFFGRLLKLMPGKRSSYLAQTQAQMRAERNRLEVEANQIVESALSDHDGSGTPRFSSRRRERKRTESEKMSRRPPSRGIKVVDALERSVRSFGKSEIALSGAETPRTRKRRTVPDFLHASRERSKSHSRDGSRSRPTSIVSGRQTPRFANGSRSNLTSPSTAGFTSEGESEFLDYEEIQAIHASQGRKGSEAGLHLQQHQPQPWVKEHRRKAVTRHSISSLQKLINWRPKGSPQASLSGSSSFDADAQTSKGWVDVGQHGSSRIPATNPVSPTTSRSRQPSGERLARRSADEMGVSARTALISSEFRGGRPQRISGMRTGSGPVLGIRANANDGSSVGRALELASDAELIRAASWGDVADEYGKDYDYGGRPLHASQYDDADESDYGVVDYGYGGGNYVYSGGVGFGSGEMDEYSLNDDARLVGAGGILSHPVSGPSSPNSASGLSASGPSDGVSSLQGMVEVGASSASVLHTHLPGTNPASLLAVHSQEIVGRRRGASIGSRQQHPSHQQVISSPLAQTPLNLDHESKDDLFEQPYSLDDDEDPALHVEGDEDDGSSYHRHLARLRSNVRSKAHDEGDASSGTGERICVYGRGHQSLTVDDEVPDLSSNIHSDQDEGEIEESESSEDDPPPLEVRRRRPSEIIRSQSRGRRELREPEPIIDVDPGSGSDVDIH